MPLANASGKGMWFSFTTNPLDASDYHKLDPHAIVAQAVHAGLHYVELRTAYGGFFEITPEAKPTIDAIVDGLAAHGIGTIAWTVPRDAGFDDLSQSVRSAYYRTANGTYVAGLAVDLERGDEFMGGAPQGPSALWQYIAYVRAALGPRALIIATVEDPYLEHLTQAAYPYAQIAGSAPRRTTCADSCAHRTQRFNATRRAPCRSASAAKPARTAQAAPRPLRRSPRPSKRVARQARSAKRSSLGTAPNRISGKRYAPIAGNEANRVARAKPSP
jgi:hypothetical protein